MYQPFVDPIANAITSAGSGDPQLGAQQDAQREQLSMMKRQANQQAFDKSYSEVAKSNERLNKDFGVTHPELASLYQQEWGNKIDEESDNISKNPRADSVAHYHLNKYNNLIHDKDLRSFLQKGKLEEANMEEEEKALEKAPDYIKEKYKGKLGKGRQVLKRGANGELTKEFALSPEDRAEMMREVYGKKMSFEKYTDELGKQYVRTNTPQTQKYLNLSQKALIGAKEKEDLMDQIKWDGPLKNETKMWEDGQNGLKNLINNNAFIQEQVSKGDFKSEDEARNFYNNEYKNYQAKVEKAYNEKINDIHNRFLTRADDTSKNTVINNKTTVNNVQPEGTDASPSLFEAFRGYKHGQTVNREAIQKVVNQFSTIKEESYHGKNDSVQTIHTTPVSNKSMVSFRPTSAKYSSYWLDQFKKEYLNSGAEMKWNMDSNPTFNKNIGRLDNGQIIIPATVYDDIVGRLFENYKKQNKDHIHMFNRTDSGFYSNKNDFAEKVLGIKLGAGQGIGSNYRQSNAYYTMQANHSLGADPSGEVWGISNSKEISNKGKHELLNERKQHYQRN